VKQLVVEKQQHKGSFRRPRHVGKDDNKTEFLRNIAPRESSNKFHEDESHKKKFYLGMLRESHLPMT
jgi:hypothetical protein